MGEIINLQISSHFGHLGVHGRIILKLILRKQSEDVTWMAQSRDQQCFLVNTVMNLQVSKKAENFLTS
jgi:hypothetical protein